MSKSSEKAQEKSKNLKSFDLGKVKGFLILIINVGVSTALLFFIGVPQYNRYKTLKEDITRQEQEIAKVSAHLQYLQDLVNLQNRLQENVQVSKQAITEKDDTPYLQNQLLQMAEISNVEVKSLSLSGITDPKDESSAGTVKSQMGISGSYGNVMVFFDRLESSRRLITVESFSVSNKGTTFGLGQFDLNLTLGGYFMPDVDASDVTIEQIVAKPRLENVINHLEAFDYYEPRELNIQVGTQNPFEATGGVQGAESVR